jgi:aspartate aminotransferase
MFSKRTSYIDISGIRKMFELAKAEGVINLGLGEPDFSIPDSSKKAIIKALEKDQTHYTPSKGLQELRIGIAKRLNQKGIKADHECIIVTSGASEALEISLLTLVEEGDEVLIPDPGFVSYAPLTRISGGKPVPYPVKAQNSYELDSASIEEKMSSKVKALIINTPANPTGAVSEKKEIKKMAKLADEWGVHIISDEVYDEIVYEGQHHCIGKYSDLAVTVNSFSKNYGMTGLRLGYLHGSEDLVNEALKIHQYVQASTNSLSQAAAIAALKGGNAFTKRMVGVLRSRRDLTVRLLNKIDGVKCMNPRGAFYVFADFSSYGNSSTMAQGLLRKARVVVTPGAAFGSNGEGYLRFSYATSEENIIQGFERVSDYLKHLYD